MAKTPATQPPAQPAAQQPTSVPAVPVVPGGEAVAQVIPQIIEEELQKSYLDYAMSVIIGRALPDVRDGLKPVHRRILYAMNELSNRHNQPYKKCARIVGEVLGKYHPHGDVAVYDALVRMAQDFSLRYPIVDGQGNFGSVDGDPAAHMRYTEARLTKISDELLQDLDKDTVNMVENFDGSLKEPSVLPSKFPNLLVNGSSGIAVGMATNIPPHNLAETCAAAIALLDNPQIETMELAKLMPGPDFPTGGIIKGQTGILQYYAGGRGKLRVHSVITQEKHKDRMRLVITELPYQLNKADLVTEIADAIKDKRIDGIADIRDESDRDGMRVVLDLKKDATPEIVENQLVHTTRVQMTFGVIMLAIVDGQPKVLGLKGILEQYLLHRRVVVRRRTQYELTKAEDKAHLLEGLVIALDHIDPIITLLKGAKNTEEARAGLMGTYKLSEKQANAILEMRLSRLTGLEQTKIRDDLAATRITIEDLKDILAKEHRITAIIKEELTTLVSAYPSPRRTKIEAAAEEDLNLEDLIVPEDVVVTISQENYCKRVPVTTYRAQARGGKGITAATTKDEDAIAHLFVANTHSWLLVFTDKGRVYWTKVYTIPEGSRQSKGKPIINIVKVAPGEKVRAVIPVKEFTDDRFLFFATKNGTVKKTVLSAYGNVRQSGINAINLEQNDDLVQVLLTTGHDTIFLASKDGMAVRFSEEDVRGMGRSSTGVIGIRLTDKDEVADAIISHENQAILTVTENGYGKRTESEEYRHINRGGKGVINIMTNDRNGHVVAVRSVEETKDVMLISKSGITIRTPATGISVIGRNTQGVRLMNLKAGDKVVACTVLDHEEDVEPVSETPAATNETTAAPTDDKPKDA
jgi:DNA gyrase subunit A